MIQSEGPITETSRGNLHRAGLPSTLLLQRSGSRKARLRSSEVSDLTGEDPPRRLCCAACQAPITAREEGISIAGRHVHRRVNPAGIAFVFGCFGAAPGAATLGVPTTEDAWFAGYAWSFALCRRCGEHLGWFFSGTEPSFFGLILDRLSDSATP